MNLIDTLVAISPLFILLHFFILFQYTKNINYLHFITTSIIFVGLANICEKHISNYLKLSDRYRPKIDSEYGCGVLPSEDNTSLEMKKEIGLPSGHAQFIGFLFGYFINNKQMRLWLLLLTVITLISRVHSQCHNVYQVFAGFIIGLIFGVLVKP